MDHTLVLKSLTQRTPVTKEYSRRPTHTTSTHHQHLLQHRHTTIHRTPLGRSTHFTSCTHDFVEARDGSLPDLPSGCRPADIVEVRLYYKSTPPHHCLPTYHQQIPTT
eukprot:5279915-Amphidinium_carterae.3